jgi:hypothetical protein
MKQTKLKIKYTITGILVGTTSLPIFSCGSGNCASCFGCAGAGMVAVVLALSGMNKKKEKELSHDMD